MYTQEEIIVTVKLWDYNLRAKAKDDTCIKSVERNLEKKSPIFFDMVCADLRTHQWLSAIFSFNRRTFLKYSKTQSHRLLKAKP